MVNLSLISDMILLVGIIAGGILFCCVNINYQPNSTEDSKDEHKKEN